MILARDIKEKISSMQQSLEERTVLLIATPLNYMALSGARLDGFNDETPSEPKLALVTTGPQEI